MPATRKLRQFADRVWAAVQFVPLATAIRLSPTLHRRVAAKHWARTKVTHGSMTAQAFSFYAERLHELISPRKQDLILDYGCGNGEIGKLLIKRGYQVEFAEFAAHFVDVLQAEGLTAYQLDDVPTGRYDIVLANNSIFYNHPSLLIDRIRFALSRLRRGGRLFLTDNPSLQLAGRVSRNPLRSLAFWLTETYQPRLGGFFIDERRLRRSFRDMTVLDSWSRYRKHFIIANLE